MVEQSTLEQCVAQYRQNGPRVKDDPCARYCEGEDVPHVQEAARRAAWSRDAGNKKHPHQWHLKNKVLEEISEKLVSAPFNAVQSFEDIRQIVIQIVIQNRISGFGPVAIYDTAYRIGRYMKIEPEVVYLHAGVRIGAKTFGIVHKDKRWITSEELEQYPPLKQLAKEETMAAVENFLCVYKHGKPNTESHEVRVPTAGKIKKSHGGC